MHGLCMLMHISLSYQAVGEGLFRAKFVADRTLKLPGISVAVREVRKQLHTIMRHDLDVSYIELAMQPT